MAKVSELYVNRLLEQRDTAYSALNSIGEAINWGRNGSGVDPEEAVDQIHGVLTAWALGWIAKGEDG